MKRSCDDAYVSQFGRDFLGRVIYFGQGPCSDPRVLKIDETRDGIEVHFRAHEQERSLKLELLGAHNALNAMAGLAVALEAGVDLDAAVEALSKLTAGDRRGFFRCAGGGSSCKCARSVSAQLSRRNGSAPVSSR